MRRRESLTFWIFFSFLSCWNNLEKQFDGGAVNYPILSSAPQGNSDKGIQQIPSPSCQLNEYAPHRVKGAEFPRPGVSYFLGYEIWLGIISEWEFFSQQKIDGGNWEGGGRRAAAGSGSETFNRPWRVQIWLSSNHWICQNIVCVLLNKVLFSEFQLRWNRIGFPLHFLSHSISLSLSLALTHRRTHANFMQMIWVEYRVSFFNYEFLPQFLGQRFSQHSSRIPRRVFITIVTFDLSPNKKKMRFMLIR